MNQSSSRIELGSCESRMRSNSSSDKPGGIMIGFSGSLQSR